jgi:hypothetical protein
MFGKLLKKLGLEYADVLPLLIYIGVIITLSLLVLRLLGVVDMDLVEACAPMGISLVIVAIIVLRELGL